MNENGSWTAYIMMLTGLMMVCLVVASAFMALYIITTGNFVLWSIPLFSTTAGFVIVGGYTSYKLEMKINEAQKTESPKN